MLNRIECQSEMWTGVERPVLAVFTRDDFEGWQDPSGLAWIPEGPEERHLGKRKCPVEAK